MAMSIVESMRNLAKKGKTIICTIHQPSSEVYEMFDRLFLMAEGRVAFCGELADAPKFFGSQGYPCPVNYNPADFYIKTLAILPTEVDECKKKVQAICNGFDQSVYTNQLKLDIANSSYGGGNFSAVDFLQAISEKKSSDYKTGSWNQLRWLLWRASLGSARNPMETKITVIQTIFIAIVFGLIFLRQKIDQSGVQNINGVLFLFITNNSFSNMFPVINSFPPEIPIFLREHQAGMYRVINYYFSKVISEVRLDLEQESLRNRSFDPGLNQQLPRFLIIPLLFVAIAYWMVGLNPDVGRFFICVVTIIFVSNTTVSFGKFKFD